MADYSYIGSGRIYLREIGGTTGLVEVGNCSALSLNVTEDTIELKDYTQSGGGTFNEVKRISAVEASMTLHELNAANLARALYGTATTTATGTVTDESKANVQKGDFVATTFMPSAITTVKVGASTKVAGTDYEVRGGGIYIIPDGSIANNDTVLITYTKAAADVVNALTSSGKEYEMLFDGLNEARSGKKTRVNAYRVKIGALASLGMIGDDFAAMEVTGKLLKDTAKSGAGVSQYFKIEIQA